MASKNLRHLTTPRSNAHTVENRWTVMKKVLERFKMCIYFKNTRFKVHIWIYLCMYLMQWPLVRFTFFPVSLYSINTLSLSCQVYFDHWIYRLVPEHIPTSHWPLYQLFHLSSCRGTSIHFQLAGTAVPTTEAVCHLCLSPWSSVTVLHSTGAPRYKTVIF